MSYTDCQGSQTGKGLYRLSRGATGNSYTQCQGSQTGKELYQLSRELNRDRYIPIVKESTVTEL